MRITADFLRRAMADYLERQMADFSRTMADYSEEKWRISQENNGGFLKREYRRMISREKNG